MSKEEVLHLFEFGDEEILEMMPELAKEGSDLSDRMKGKVEDTDQKKKAKNEVGPKSNPLLLPSGTSLPDKVMENLLNRHHPRYFSSSF